MQYKIMIYIIYLHIDHSLLQILPVMRIFCLLLKRILLYLFILYLIFNKLHIF